MSIINSFVQGENQNHTSSWLYFKLILSVVHISRKLVNYTKATQIKKF